ncbi:isochorismatase family protein [Nonomuraea sp. NBC_01738]|uniref:isochorismatase family protein n=1 Tax=Nonomuraea sp. NBC_01738 TaxID=2976003 RepID=UPI002E0D9167|nr:isochorismatase family protein [Nonomuraea sp. NBC_01738]
MTPSTSLRDLSGLPGDLPKLAGSALIMIDFQNTYRTGVMRLDGADEAVSAAARLLAAAREAGSPVIHVINDGGEGSLYDIRAEIGSISDEVAPIEGEPVVVKQYPNSFHETDLESTLRELGVSGDLILAGFMTHMCVMFTAQGAFNLGYRPAVVAEATATRPLAAPDGGVVPSATLQAASLTTITDLFGVVAPAVDDLIG